MAGSGPQGDRGHQRRWRRASKGKQTQGRNWSRADGNVRVRHGLVGGARPWSRPERGQSATSRRARVRRDRRCTLVEQRRGGEPPTERAERGSDATAEPESDLSSRHRRRGGAVTDPGGESPPSGRDQRPRSDSPRGERSAGGAGAGRPATRHVPDARRARGRGNPPTCGQTAHRSRALLAERRAEGRLRSRGGIRRKRRVGTNGHEPLDHASSREEVGAKPGDREVVPATNGRRGAGRSDAARLPTRSKPSQGGAPEGTPVPIREALVLRRPTRAKPGEPRPGTGCNMPGAVNGRSRRGGEKPRGRSETDGVATVGRRRSSDLRDVDVHGDIGRWASSKGRSSRRGRIHARREVQRIQLGSAGTPKARPRWEAA